MMVGGSGDTRPRIFNCVPRVTGVVSLATLLSYRTGRKPVIPVEKEGG
jgi:hypothetical protein